MAEVAKKFKALDEMLSADHVVGLKTLIVPNPDKYVSQDLFEIRLGNARLGPILNQDLKAYVAQAANFPVSCLISQFASEQWVPLLQHPYFQRRKPQLVSQPISTTTKEAYYVLQQGKKQGPYSHAQIDRMLDQKEILVSDQISADEGQTWGRVYQIDRFDRRQVGSQALPFMPEWQVFNNSFDEVERDLTNDHRSAETDAIASLAYLENLQAGKAGKIAAKNPGAKKESFHTGPLPRNTMLIVGAIAAVLILFAWLSSGSDPAPVAVRTPQTDNAPPVKNAAPARAPKPTVPKHRLGQDAKKAVAPSLPDRMIQSINKKNPSDPGFRQSRTFKRAQVGEARSDDDFAYDQDRPLEQDPIGSKLSRETINPDDDYQQELREEVGHDAEPNYADDRFDNAAAEKDFARMYEEGNEVGEGDLSDDPNY